jgi:hypothetical protein
VNIYLANVKILNALNAVQNYVLSKSMIGNIVILVTILQRKCSRLWNRRSNPEMTKELKVKIEVQGASKFKLEHEGKTVDTLDIAINALQELKKKLCPELCPDDDD